MRAARSIALDVNGVVRSLHVTRAATLLHVLRNDLALNGPKYGCGLGQCGACTVLVDGVAARACVIPAIAMEGRAITTLEGLAGDASLHFVQQAFIDAQAAQCGYCLNGMIMATAALLAEPGMPDDARIAAALSHHLCRCGAHVEIVDAVRLALSARPVAARDASASQAGR